MRNAIIAILLIAGVAVMLWLFRRPSHDESSQPATRAKSGHTTTASASSEPATPSPSSVAPTGVRRLDPETRKRLGAQIEAARAKARAKAAESGPPNQPSNDQFDLATIGKPLQDALQAAIPILAECYGKQAEGNTAAALMTLASDPELGTVIDTDAVTNTDNKPLDPKLEECLRDTIESLGLPPIGDRPGTVKLQYSFKF